MNEKRLVASPELVQFLGEINQLCVEGKAEAALTKLTSSSIRLFGLFDKVLIFISQAQIYGRLGRVEEALAAYDSAIDLESELSSTQASFAKWNYLTELGREAEAIELLRKLPATRALTIEERERVQRSIKLTEYNCKTHKAVRLAAAGDYDGAVSALQSISTAELEPQFQMMIFVNLATVYENARRVEASLEAYDQAMAWEEKAQSSDASIGKAYYFHRIGRNQEAVSLFQKILAGSYISSEEREKIENNVRALSH